MIAFLRHPLLKQFSAFSSILAAGKLVQLAAMPVLTRLFSPDDFGEYTTFVAVLSLCAIVGNLKFEQAIPLPRSHRASEALLRLSIEISTGFLVLLALTLSVTPNVFGNSPLGSGLLWLACVFVLAFQNLRFVLMRHGAYVPIGVAQGAQTSVQTGAQLAFGSLGTIVPGGLLVGDALGRMTGAVFLALRLRALGYGANLFHLSFVRAFFRHRRQAGWAWRRYLRASLTHTAALLVDALPTLILPFYVIALYGKGTNGLFAFAYAMVFALSGPVFAPLGQMVYGTLAAKKAKEQRIGPILRKILGISATLLLLPLGVVMVWGPDLYALVFGEAWRVAGTFAVITSLAIYGQLLTAPLMDVLRIVHKTHWQFMINALRLGLVLGVMGVGALESWPFTRFLYGFTGAIVLAQTFAVLQILRVTRSV